MYKKLLFIILPFLLFSCTSNVDEAEVKKARQFFEPVFQDSVLDSPEFPASLGYKSTYGLTKSPGHPSKSGFGQKSGF